MGKGWPFRKTKHDCEARSSSAKKAKTSRYRWYVPVELAHRLLEENRPIPWSDAGMLSGGWYLNYRLVPVPPVPHEGRQWQYEIRRSQFILPPDVR
jgi:hypothetical protein